MDRWSQLSLKDKSDLMSLYIKNGISSLEEIKKHYNSYQDGGKITFQQWKDRMKTKYPDIEMDNDKAGYNYEEYFNNNYDAAIRQLDNLQHFPDTYKLPNHPTFSNESIYSRGPMIGGNWINDSTFNPSIINRRYYPNTYREDRPYTEREIYNSFATGGHLFQGGGHNDPNFVGGATALKKNYDYELEHLAEKYPVTAKGPWHDYEIHNPSPSQKAHWNELSRMYNRVAQRPDYQYLNPTNILEYAPGIGDAIDAGHSLYDLQQGNTGLGLAGLGMLALPNIVEKPLKLGKQLLKAPAQIIKNVRANRNIDSQNEVLEQVWKNFLERETRETGVYRNARAKKDIYNNNSSMIHLLPDELHYPVVDQTLNPIRYMYNGTIPKTLKEYVKGFKGGIKDLLNTDMYNLNDHIYVNPLKWLEHPNRFKGTLGHEVQHSVQHTLPIDYQLSTNVHTIDYFVNNRDNKYTRNLLQPFERNSGKWIGSPDELDSEMIKWKMQHDIPLNVDFLSFSPDQQQKFIKKAMKRFKLNEGDATNILNGLSRNQYFKFGGELK